MILFLNGSLGVGKTSVANHLLWCQPQTVLLEGDALCNLHPFDAYDQPRIQALNDVFAFMVARYRKLGYTRFVIDTIFEKEDQAAAVSALLREEDRQVFHYLLHAGGEARKSRIEARRRENYLWELERSAELQGLLLAEFRDSSFVTMVDTSEKTVKDVGDWILNDARDRG